MSELMDFSFNNQLIRDFFLGDDTYVPVSELIYIHEHPLIRNSFLIEMERLINETTEVLVSKNMQGSVINKFIESTKILGAQLPTINKQNAPKILNELRKLYLLCNSLLK